METLESYLGEPETVHQVLVISDPEPEKKPEVHYTGPVEKRDITVTQEVGEFIIDRLNRNIGSFQGRWLIWAGTERDLKRGRLMFEVQSCGADAYRTRRRNAVITIKLPREPWWVRFSRTLGSYLLRVSRRESKKCFA